MKNAPTENNIVRNSTIGLPRRRRYAKRKPQTRYNVTYKNYIAEGENAIKAFNLEKTGFESAVVNYYDENGNRRRKFVPHAILMEMNQTGCVSLVQIASDGVTHIPLHTGPIVYRSIAPCIEVLKNFTHPSTTNR